MPIIWAPAGLAWIEVQAGSSAMNTPTGSTSRIAWSSSARQRNCSVRPRTCSSVCWLAERAFREDEPGPGESAEGDGEQGGAGAAEPGGDGDGEGEGAESLPVGQEGG